VGGLFLLKKGENKGVFMLVWSLTILLLSRVYLIGLNLIPIRVLEIASYPLIIMAGYGLAVTLDVVEKRLNKDTTPDSTKNTHRQLKKHVKLVIMIILAFSPSCQGWSLQEVTHLTW
jgi:asparagine N-glycosylation enzyme membrane subunit Stt3